MSQTLDKIHEFARGKINLATEKMLREYNLKLSFQNYKEGDLVWYYAHKINRKGSPKLHCHWQGPLLRGINDVVYNNGKPAKSKPKLYITTLTKGLIDPISITCLWQGIFINLIIIGGKVTIINIVIVFRSIPRNFVI